MPANDVTSQAVRDQLDALKHPLYEVGIFDPEADRMLLRRDWDRETVLRALPYLRAQNMQGKHIYLRPAGTHPYSLIDDLSTEKLAALKSAGFQPVLVVQTSPGNHQAWLNHGRELPHDMSTAAAKALATRFGGDPSSADWRHFGRMAGLTNRKEKYRRADGHFPFVRLLERAPGCVYSEAKPFLEVVEASLATDRAELAARREAWKRANPGRASTGDMLTIQDFRNSPKYGGDGHRVDLAYAAYALSRGVGVTAIEAAIATRDLSHKGGKARQDDYIARTIAKAQESVQQTRGVQR